MHITPLLSLILLSHPSLSTPISKAPQDTEVFPNGAYIQQTEFGEILTLPANYDFSQPHFNTTLLTELRKRGEAIPPLKGVRPPRDYNRDIVPKFQNDGLMGVVDDVLGGDFRESDVVDLQHDGELITRGAEAQTEAIGQVASILGDLIVPTTKVLPRSALNIPIPLPQSSSPSPHPHRRDFPTRLPRGEIHCETSSGSPESIDLIIISERISQYPDPQWCCSGPGRCQELEASGSAKVGICNSKGENHCFHCKPVADAVYVMQEKCRRDFPDAQTGRKSNRAGGYVRLMVVLK
ncbi:hypothetical protein BZA77DRAFT_293295 [Pyronema omphalodes]|nr:hypothetical protein BZA77DRAFT_293295 [Pyronema omphalodes]